MLAVDTTVGVIEEWGTSFCRKGCESGCRCASRPQVVLAVNPVSSVAHPRSWLCNHDRGNRKNAANDQAGDLPQVIIHCFSHSKSYYLAMRLNVSGLTMLQQ